MTSAEVSPFQVRWTTRVSAAAARPVGEAGAVAVAGSIGLQPSLPARYLAGVALAACEAVSWGRLAFSVAPGPMPAYSAKRASCQRKLTLTPLEFAVAMSS